MIIWNSKFTTSKIVLSPRNEGVRLWRNEMDFSLLEQDWQSIKKKIGEIHAP